jgi:bisphosphoglycerate-dependent phosphoglycerate mutase
MMNKKRVAHGHGDQRRTHERRSDEAGPPMGWRDRRRNVERRLPTVVEDEISLREWFKRVAAYLAKKSAEKAGKRSADDLLERQNFTA